METKNLDIYVGKVDLGRIEEVFIEFGIEDESVKRDIFHSHITLIVFRMNKTVVSRSSEMSGYGHDFLHRILDSEDNDVCWDSDFGWQEPVANLITDHAGIPENTPDASVQKIVDYVIKEIEQALLSNNTHSIDVEGVPSI
jgi:hypothetical protein